MKNKIKNALMQTAFVWAECSSCNNKKVGCVISKKGRIIATGYNGTLPGFDNNCEINGVTKNEVLHAEQNALMFCVKNGLQTKGCVMFCTLLPCETCSKLIIAAGIKKIYFNEVYRCKKGYELLKNSNIEVLQL